MANATNKDGRITQDDVNKFSGARVFISGNVSLVNNANTTIPFDSKRYDTDGYWAVANPTRLTAPKSGYYSIGGAVVMDANSTGRRYVTVQLNGSITLVSAGMTLNIDGSSVAHRPVGAVTTDFFLNAGDYVELISFQDSGVALNANNSGAPQGTELWIRYIGQ